MLWVVAFAALLLAEHFALKLWAKHKARRWEGAIRTRSCAGEELEPEATEPESGLLRWYFGRHFFLLRAAQILEEEHRHAGAAHHYMRLYREAADAAQQGLARKIWDNAEALFDDGKVEAAFAIHESALADTRDRGPRFKLLCRLGVLAALSGRYGAGDGYIQEAEQEMPSGDPGFKAYLERSATVVAEAKRARGSINLVGLVQLGKRTRG